MTPDKLREIVAERPFLSFTLHMADGRSFEVRHPELLSISPNGRIAHLFTDQERSEFIDVLMITSVEQSHGNGQSRNGA